MNKAYKSLYNEATGTYVAVAENVTGRGKRSSSRVSKAAAIATVAIAGSMVMGGAGAQVSINNPDGTISGVETLTFVDDGSITGLASMQVEGALSAATLSIATGATTIDGGGIETNNINVAPTGSVVVGATTVNDAGVVVGSNVALNSTGLVITGGPSVTAAGINAGGRVITGVVAGTANDHAVNVGQLNVVSGVADAAQTAAAQNATAISTHNTRITNNMAAIASNAEDIADNAAEIELVRTSATAGWNLSTDGGTAAKVAPGESVDFSSDGNIEVSRSGTNLTVSLADAIEVQSISAGSAAFGSDGLTIVGGPSVTAGGIDAGGLAITNMAPGEVALGSQEAITGGQVYNYFLEEGATGVRYFRAKSVQADSQALGAESVAIGPKTVAEGASSFAAGDGAITTEAAKGAIALGQGAAAGTVKAESEDGIGSIAIGRDSQASGNSTVALGDDARVESEYVANATALGAGARVTGNFSTGAVAVGADAQASAANAVALGAEAQASGEGSVAVGQEANAAAEDGLAMGTGAYAGTGSSIALGTGAGVGTEGSPGGDRTDHIAIGTAAGQDVIGNQSTAIGFHAGHGVVGDGNIALGVEAGRGLEGNNNISIGVNANDGAGIRAQAIAIGDATAAGSDSVALGSGAQAVGSETVALGKDSSAGANGVALGAHSEAEGSNIALGRNSAARESDVTGSGYLTGTAAPGSAVSVGNSNPGEAFQRRITNVSDGSQRYDAVNVGQLQGAQQAVAKLVGGNVTVESSGSFGGYVIELQDQDGNSHKYATVAEAINAVSSGAISVLPGDAVIYNANGTVTVARGVVGTDAVNVEQLNEAVAESGVKYYSANTTIDANRENDGATAVDAMAIGPAAVAGGTSSLAVGHAARVNAGAHNGVALGHDVSARAENATVLGNRSHSYDVGGVAIGQQAVSRGQNSIVMGTNAQADPKSGQTVDNAIVIGTDAEATADDGIAVGRSALASEDRAVAQGYDAHAMALDSQASGTRAHTTGVNSQASGTDALASGTNAIATGTNSRGYATDGIAMGTGAISGFVVDIPGDETRNHGSIAIGNTSKADDLNAMALGVEAQAHAESATAIGTSAVVTEDAKDGLAVGSRASVSAQNASAFGQGAEATALDALAVGSGAQVTHEGSVALGAGSVTASHNSGTYTFGTYGVAGSTSSDTRTVSVGTEGNERQMQFVAPGVVSATSTDAINGSQLHATNEAFRLFGGNTAGIMGGDARFDPDTGGLTFPNIGGDNVPGEHSGTIHDAIAYAAQGWNVTADGDTATRLAPGDTVDFGNTDDNINIGRSPSGLTFDLAENINLGDNGSVTTGVTVMNDDGVRVGDDVHLSDTGLVIGDANGPRFTSAGISAGGQVITNVAPGVNGTDAVNVDQLTELADTPLTFAGDAGTDVDRLLGQTVNLVGGATATAALTDGNIGVVADGTDTLTVKLNKDIDLGEDGSLAIGDATLDTDGLDVVDGAGNSTAIGAGTIAVTDGTGTTTIGANVVSVGGANPIVISGDAGTIGGLTNLTFDPDNIVSGQAATEDQLSRVYDVANAGWNLSGSGENQVNIGPDGAVDFQGDQNINIAQTGTDQDGVIEIALNRDLDVDSITAGDSVLDTDGLTVTDSDGNVTTVAADGTTVEDDEGNVTIVAADGTTVEDDEGNVTTVAASGATVSDGAGNSTAIGAGTIAVTDGTDTTTIGSNVVSVGGANPIVISGDTGTIGGLTNLTFDPDNIASGQAATENQLGQVYDVANAGWNLSGSGEDPVNIGPEGAVDFQGDQNISIAQTGSDQDGVIEVTLNKDIDLGEDGSLTIGDSVLNTDGLAVTDSDGNVTTVAADGTTVADDEGNVTIVAADGTTVTDGAGNSTAIGAGTIAVTDGTNTTTIGSTIVSVGGANPIVISGDTGTIGGLANQTIDYSGFADGSGRAATEEQLDLVNQTANAGWNLSGSGENQVNIGPDGAVDFQGDQNISVAQTGTDQDGVIEVTLNKDIDLGEDGSLTIGDSVLNTDGLAVTDSDGNVTTVAADGTTVADDEGNVTTIAADGTTVTDGAGNSTAIGVGTIAVTDGTGTTTIGGSVVSVGGGNPVVISGDTGTIGGLQNQTILYSGFADGSGRAATEEQLGSITGFLDLSMDENNTPVFNYNGQSHASLTDALNSMHWNVEAPAPDPATGGTGGSGGSGGPGGSGGSGGTGDSGGSGGVGAGSGGSTPIHNTNTLGFVEGDNVVITKTERVDSGGQTVGADVKVALAQDISVNSITAVQLDAQSVTANEIAINNGGPIINERGIDMSGNRITNVAPGIEGTDAVNVNQLSSVAGSLQGQVNDLRHDLRRQDKKLSAGVAAAMATASLPQAYLPGKTMMGLAAGTWNGESGMAIGFSGISDNGHWVYKLSGNTTSRGDYGGAVGIGYQW